MANEKNLKMFTSDQSREEAKKNGKKGGIASGIARREKKTIQQILTDFLNNNVQSQKVLKKIAKDIGITGEKSIKELVTVVCILNTLNKGDVDKLQKLCEILGEDNKVEMLEDVSEAEEDVFGND